MKILFFGDIVGRPGREALKKVLPEFKKEFGPDLILANAENSAHGQGINEKTILELQETGVDFMTSGDHAFNLGDSDSVLEDKKLNILRPMNWSLKNPGRGYEMIIVGARRLMFVNLAGQVFMHQHFASPFEAMEKLLEDFSLKGKEQGSQAVDAIILDFHAEATSEKAAMGWFLDGKISALLGTHTHVPTADEKILPGGTAFISDVGMVGPRDSVLGVSKEVVIKRFLTQRPARMELAEGPVEINGIFLETNEQAGLAEKIERIRKIVALD